MTQSTYISQYSGLPQLRDTLLGFRSQTERLVPQLSWLDSGSEVITATALFWNALQPATAQENVGYARSETFNRLATDPTLLLRLSALDRVDVELFVDTYTYTQPEPVVLAAPPADPFALPRPADAKYIRSTSLYIYQAVSVPPASTLIWDARWPLVVNSTGQIIESVDQVAVVRAEARAAIEDPELQPTYSTGLAGLGSTVNVADPTVGINAYSTVLVNWLSETYSAASIPPAPSTFSQLLDTLVLVDGPGLESPDQRAFFQERLQRLIDGDPQFDLVKGTTVWQGTLREYLGTNALAIGLLSLQAELAGGDVGLENFVEQLATPDSFDLVLPNGYIGSLAALVGGFGDRYFQRWVFYIRPALAAPVGPGLLGLPELQP
jgi:hypothetical protein